MNSQFAVWAFSCMLATVSLFLNMILSTVTIAAFGGLQSRSLISVLVEWALLSTPLMYIFLLRDKRKHEAFRSIYVKMLVAAPLILAGFMLYHGQDNEGVSIMLVWVSLVFFTYQNLVRCSDTLE